jgi:ApbE superfamily uncharacterized protein (UPF0280 family)
VNDRATEVERVAALALQEARSEIQAYAADHGGFFESLEPLHEDPAAPPVVAAMIRAGCAAAVGPMAAVAGAVAEAVGRAVKTFGFDEVVVENGGDLWIDVRSPLTVSVYAGLSSLSETFGIVVPQERCPCGLACSSGTVGPSLSFGKADAAIVLCRDAAAADAWATALGNSLRVSADLEPAIRWIISLSGAKPVEDPAPAIIAEELRPFGALAVMADRLAAAGSITLAPLDRPSAPLRRELASDSIEI